MSDAVETRVIEIVAGTTFRIEIPASWSLTYGQAAPFSGPKTGGGVVYHSGLCLRIYEGAASKGQCRALYDGVKSFRDISIPTQVRAVRYFGKEDWLVDDGSYINGKAALVEKGWVDESQIVAAPPDEPEIEDRPASYLRKRA